MTLTLLLLTAVAAVGDWIAVAQRRFRLEHLLKPLVLVLLIGAAGSADLGVSQPWLIAGLVFGLLGDVGLMLADSEADEPDLPFLAGLGSFLVGHICYLIAFLRHGVNGLHLLAGALIVFGIGVLTLPSVLPGARRVGGQLLMTIVAGYAVLLSVMTIFAIGTTEIATAIGGLLFLGSDSIISWERFVKKVPRGPVLIIVTYHLAQVLIVLGLVRSL